MFVTERFVLPEAVKDELRSMTPDFGYGQFSEVVFYRTYSRSKPDGSMEDWADVVIRCVEGTFSIRKDWYIKTGIRWDDDFWNTYSRGFAISMFKMHFLPPGRGLWMMGTDFIYERGSMALQNCGAITVGDNIGECCNWIADALMLGVGIGFEPIRNDDFETYFPEGEYIYKIADSREGWAASIQAAIDCYCFPDKKKPIFDYSLVRPIGLPISGFGGLSSGPEPLMLLHQRIDKFFEMYSEHEWYDTVLLKTDIINCIGACVIAGNVRRSAEICIGSINDETFLNLKNYEKYPYRAAWGWCSNNSATLDTNEDYEKLNEIANRVIINAEPGIINRHNIQFGRIGKSDNLKLDKATLFNPCQPYSALILTKNGIREFGTLKRDDEIWSETGWTKVLNIWSSGFKDVYKYTTTAGAFVGTRDHNIVCEGFKSPVGFIHGIDICLGINSNFNFNWSNLDPQDIVDGLVQGDGTQKDKQILLCVGDDDQDYFSSEVSDFIGECYSNTKTHRVDTRIYELPRTYLRTIPKEYLQGDSKKVCGFLRGLYSANGSIVHPRITLKAASFSVIESIQIMLSSVGILSYWTKNNAAKVKFENGEYFCKQSYDLNINNLDSIKRFKILIGFIQEYKNEKLQYILDLAANCDKVANPKITYDIIQKDYLGNEEVFDITVDNLPHTYWTAGLNVSNCGEQPLVSHELCTLVETLPTKCKTVDDWCKACEYATVYASTVTLLPTHRPETNAVMLKNRRIGVGIIDFSGWKHTTGLNQVIKHLRKGYTLIRSINRWCAEEAGVPESIRVTTMKPSGSVSKVAGKTPGLGHPNFHYTLRRIRVADNSPIVNVLTAANIPYEKDVVSVGTLVFEFPVLQGPAKPAAQVSLWEQAVNLTLMQSEWSDNAVSNTLTFIPKWELVFRSDINNLDETSIAAWTQTTRINIRATILKNVTYSETTKHRLEIKEQWGSKVLEIYQYNANHEEDDIEHVLAACAPSIKSLSLLPQTGKGVYAQMPEEGITRDEYEHRLDNINPIDWSKLRHNMAEPDKYCTGDACELPKV
ncbi:MAG: hypothetical protein KGI50_05605 [Patescibacteria group bacterium]|nr:hypothetical protein [Patescibacteria group bacterium]MDE2438893.1 hypothetical protein [Patescibacteria group bacterium]